MEFLSIHPSVCLFDNFLLYFLSLWNIGTHIKLGFVESLILWDQWNMAANASLGKYIASHERPLWSFIVMLHNSNKPRSHLEHCDRYNYSFGQLMQSWDEKTCHDPKEVTKVQLYSQSGLQLSIFKLFHVHAYKKPCSINLLLLLGV